MGWSVLLRMGVVMLQQIDRPWIRGVAAAIGLFVLVGALAGVRATADTFRAPEHPQAAKLSDAERERIASIQSDVQYYEVRTAYVACMRESGYGDFDGDSLGSVSMRDGSVWPPEVGDLLTPGQMEFREDATLCQSSSGYTSLLDANPG